MLKKNKVTLTPEPIVFLHFVMARTRLWHPTLLKKFTDPTTAFFCVKIKIPQLLKYRFHLMKMLVNIIFPVVISFPNLKQEFQDSVTPHSSHTCETSWPYPVDNLKVKFFPSIQKVCTSLGFAVFHICILLLIFLRHRRKKTGFVFF